MKINPYIVARSVRALLLVVFVVLLFPLPFVFFSPDASKTFTYFAVLAFIFIAICVASVFCTKYVALKPAPNKKAERLYGIIGITLILVAFSLVVVAPAIIASMR